MSGVMIDADEFIAELEYLHEGELLGKFYWNNSVMLAGIIPSDDYNRICTALSGKLGFYPTHANLKVAIIVIAQ